MSRTILASLVAVLAGSGAHAAIVEVRITGTVIFRAGNLGAPLSGVSAGNTGVMSFTLDSADFVEDLPGDIRSYPINQSSFALAFQPSGVSVGLLNPFPAGATPYFSIVDGFPVSDGFFVSTLSTSPGGVPISQTPLQANLELGYEGSTLSSLDVLDAAGTYGFDGLTRFGYNLWQASMDNVRLDMDFESMTIRVVPAPSMLGFAAIVSLAAAGRRRRK